MHSESSAPPSVPDRGEGIDSLDPLSVSGGEVVDQEERVGAVGPAQRQGDGCAGPVHRHTRGRQLMARHAGQSAVGLGKGEEEEAEDSWVRTAVDLLKAAGPRADERPEEGQRCPPQP